MFSDEYVYERISPSGLKVVSKSGSDRVFLWSSSTNWEEVSKLEELLRFFGIERVGDDDIPDDDIPEEKSVSDIIKDSQNESM